MIPNHTVHVLHLSDDQIQKAHVIMALKLTMQALLGSLLNMKNSPITTISVVLRLNTLQDSEEACLCRFMLVSEL